MLEGRVVAGGFEQRLYIVDERCSGMDGGNPALDGGQVCRREQAGQGVGLAALATGGEQGTFGGTVRIAEFDTHQEAVELRFGQREGADLVRRVLRGDDEEGARQRVGLPFGGDLALFHRFEQRALRLGCGAVDLVGQHQLGEHGAWQEAECALVALEDRDARYIGRQQVAGELDARELQAEQTGQRVGQGRLAHAGQVFDQQMTIGEQAGNGQPDFSTLAENDLAGLVQDLVEWLGGTGKRCEFAF